MTRHRSPSLSEQEWISLIQECRTSGLADKDWCDQHHISHSTFYHHIKKLRDKACQLPEHTRKLPAPAQQVVELQLIEEDPTSSLTAATGETTEGAFDNDELPIITVHVGIVCIDITNKAAEDTIRHTLKALPFLC